MPNKYNISLAHKMFVICLILFGRVGYEFKIK